MEDAGDPPNTSILSQSYIEGVKRITGNRNKFDDEYKICDEIIEKRQQSWAWLFEKFSEISDDVELNIHTLRPDSESSGSLDDEPRLSVRKTAAQIQHWIDTGNPPYQVVEAEAMSDTEESHSISESEGEDFELTQSSSCASMIVNNEPTNGGVKGIVSESSASSVDTATYIKNNTSTSKIKEKDGRVNNFANMDNNIVARSINAGIPTVLLHRITEDSRTKVTQESMEVGEACSSVIVASNGIALDDNHRDKRDEILATTSKNDEIEASEVNSESKESGIGSSAVECTEERQGTEAKKDPDYSDEIFPSLSQSSSIGKRKLFTKNQNIFDLYSPEVEKAVKNLSRVGEKNFHPALDSPCSIVEKKITVRPRLLTLSRNRARFRKSTNISFNTKKRSRSLLSKSRTIKNSLKLNGNKTKTAIDVEETSNIMENKSPNHSVNVDCADGEDKNIQIASQVDKTVPTILNSVTKTTEKVPMNKSTYDRSSSLSSQDASLIINEELNGNSRKSSEILQQKNQARDSSCVDIEKSDGKIIDSDQGSIFKTCANSSYQTRENWIENIQNIRKNLCTSDLKSSEDTKSTSNSSPSNENNFQSDDSFGNASTIVLSDFGRRVTRSSKRLKKNLMKNFLRFIPVVVLHDFINLRNCCGESEKENNIFWSRKLNEKESLRNEKERVHKRIIATINSSEKDEDNLKLKNEMEQKILGSKKPRLENGLSVSEHDSENLTSPNLNLDRQKSQSPEKKTTNSKIREINDDSNHFLDTASNFSDRMKSGIEPVDEAKSNVTFTNTNGNRWESIFVLTSSDDEDLLETLRIRSKSTRLRKKSVVNDGKIGNSVSGVENKTLNVSESTKTHQESYKIVFSSSGEENKTVKLVPGSSGRRKVRTKYSKHKRKNSKESRLTMCLEEDSCPAEDRSDDFIKNLNDELEKQSLGVNRLSEGIKKSKQSVETGRDYLVPRKNKDYTENLIDQNLSADKIFGNGGDEVEPKICSNIKIIDKENGANKVEDSSLSPVDRVPNSSQKIGKELNSEGNKRDRKLREKIKKTGKFTPRRNLLNKIARADETFDSEEEWEREVSRIPNHGGGSKIDYSEKVKRRIDESRISEKSKTCGGKKLVQIVLSDDELSGSGNVMSFLNSKNYALDNSQLRNNQDEEYKGDSDSDIFTSKINFTGPSNRRIHGEKKGSCKSSTSKRKHRDRRTTSNIIYRTKECWELDSDD